MQVRILLLPPIVSKQGWEMFFDMLDEVLSVARKVRVIPNV